MSCSERRGESFRYLGKATLGGGAHWLTEGVGRDLQLTTQPSAAFGFKLGEDVMVDVPSLHTEISEKAEQAICFLSA